MAKRPRRRPAEPEGVHADERWMASYTDMVTVLMCLFIVLFAMSTVDQEKFEALKNSLATGFGVVDEGKIDTASGVVVEPKDADEDAEAFAGRNPEDLQQEAEKEVDSLVELRDRLHDALRARGLDSDVTFSIDSRGLTVGLVGWETFFRPNNAELMPEAVAVIDTVGPILAGAQREISVEGHADFRGTSFPFPTDWELSSGRATSVLRRLVEANGVPGPSISSVGFGSARPLTRGESEAERSENRRVDIAVLSSERQDVRDLIPGVLNARGD